MMKVRGRRSWSIRWFARVHFFYVYGVFVDLVVDGAGHFHAAEKILRHISYKFILIDQTEVQKVFIPTSTQNILNLEDFLLNVQIFFNFSFCKQKLLHNNFFFRGDIKSHVFNVNFELIRYSEIFLMDASVFFIVFFGQTESSWETLWQLHNKWYSVLSFFDATGSSESKSGAFRM